jgi:hypothetical protein
MAKKTALRREFVCRHVDPAGLRVLEIGAMDEPTFAPGDAACVTYMDRYTRAEAAARKPHRALEDFADVQLVVTEKRFSGGIAERFDVLVANDVVERVPDVISWLQELDRVSTDDAWLFLGVPDRRYTFDILRRETDFTDLLRAYRLDLEQPDEFQVLSALYFHRPVRAQDVWEGAAPRLHEKRYPLREAMERAEVQAREGADVHCHVFSRETFVDVFDDLHESGLVAWEVADIDTVRRGTNEFHVALRKQQG